MDRELLLEIGCEEIPASWLPALTTQIGEVVVEQLTAERLTAEAPVETYSTPRRLTVRIGRLSERQTDLEELVNGPPVSASFEPDGTPKPAAAGFAAKNGTTVAALERVETPKGTYLAYRKRQRGKAAVDVLPGVLGGTLRGLTFPKQMHWDAMLEDGKGELVFGRPIRWLLFLYGGRVVPFAIARTPGAQGGLVQEVVTGAVTYGHRFLTTSGRAGRSIKVRSFDEYRSKLLENFVILERSERHNKIARELDAKAQRLQGRVSRMVRSESGLLQEVPDLVEYPSVIGGTFGPEFLELPEEVLTTTLVHHQHYFPVEGEDGRLKNAFLAVTNTEPDNERTIARNAERVVTARLRDARFFWEADRKIALESRLERLGTLLFHKKLGSYREKAERIERLARQVALNHFGASPEQAESAAKAARLAKADLATDMVREFTELQGTMGGIYAREEGLPEEVWKAIYFQYLPLGVEADGPPSRTQLGKAAITWASVSLADKLDTVVGLFAVGEKPTGSRDPYGLRRAGNGMFRLLVDFESLTGVALSTSLEALLSLAAAEHKPLEQWEPQPALAFTTFLGERLSYVLQSRGFDSRNVGAVVNRDFKVVRPSFELKKLSAFQDFAGTEAFKSLAVAFKRIQNLARNLKSDTFLQLNQDPVVTESKLTSDAEQALLTALKTHTPAIEHASESGKDFRQAFQAAASFAPVVDRFFKDVLVMHEDESLKNARLWLLYRLERLMLKLANISELVAES